VSDLIRVGLAGARRGPAFVAGLRAIEGVEVAAICDPNVEFLHQRADRFGITRRHTNFREMLEDAVDFVVLGPVRATPSHPGSVAPGWEGFAALVRGASLPVFALGGMMPDDLETAWRSGAHGIAMVRGSWSGA